MDFVNWLSIGYKNGRYERGIRETTVGTTFIY